MTRSEQSRPSVGRVERWALVAGAVATVAAAVVTVAAYVRPTGTGAQQQPPATSTPDTRTSVPDTRTAPPRAGAAGTFLDTLSPAAGGGHLRALPRSLQGQPGYDRSIAIACPSNQTSDIATEIEYETRQRYLVLEANLRPYREPADGIKADLFVFQDPADHLPGGPSGSPPAQVRVTMGEQAPLSAPAGAAYYLRLRVVCEKPGGLMILAGAILRT